MANLRDKMSTIYFNEFFIGRQCIQIILAETVNGNIEWGNLGWEGNGAYWNRTKHIQMTKINGNDSESFERDEREERADGDWLGTIARIERGTSAKDSTEGKAGERMAEEQGSWNDDYRWINFQKDFEQNNGVTLMC